MKQYELKQIRDSLKFGDVTTIATEVGVSAQTVQRALRGSALTETAKLCIQHAQRLIKQREERIAELKAIIAKQRAAREKASD
jgi:AraC-like DNA-binding protein